MSQLPQADRDDSCAVLLTAPARGVHLAVLAAFAETGRAPLRTELERVARSQGADPGGLGPPPRLRPGIRTTGLAMR